MTELDHVQLIRDKQKKAEERQQEYDESSKDRLRKITCQKMKTIMIGALSAIEEEFGFLWGFKENKVLTPEEKLMADKFQKARDKILDLGNGQKRNFETELDLYDVTWKRYTMNLPVVTEEEYKQLKEEQEK